MTLDLESLWDDENFTIETGVLPAGPRLSGAELGAGLIYYPVTSNLHHHLAGMINIIPARQSSLADLNVLWNDGIGTELYNPEKTAAEILRVALKPSELLVNELPEGLFGVGYATLLEADWAEPFKKSVRDDLAVIGALVEPIRRGQRAIDPSIMERAILAKQDLDAKLMWSAGTLRRHDNLTLAYANTILATAATNGMISVSAKTMDANQNDVHGCEVKYVAVIHKNNKAFYKSFAQFSTPTSESLSVGNYQMWAEKAGQSGQRRTITVNSTTQKVDLYAP